MLRGAALSSLPERRSKISIILCVSCVAFLFWQGDATKIAALKLLQRAKSLFQMVFGDLTAAPHIFVASVSEMVQNLLIEQCHTARAGAVTSSSSWVQECQSTFGQQWCFPHLHTLKLISTSFFWFSLFFCSLVSPCFKRCTE